MEIQLDSDENRMFVENEPDQDGDYIISVWSEDKFTNFYLTKEQIDSLKEHLNSIS